MERDARTTAGEGQRTVPAEDLIIIQTETAGEEIGSAIPTVPEAVSAEMERTEEATDLIILTVPTVRIVLETALEEMERTKEAAVPITAVSDREMKEEMIPEETRA